MGDRDFQAEYRRRVERGRLRGLTRAQARGHPEVGRPYASGRQLVPRYDRVLEEGVKEVRNGATISQAAKVAGVPEERLRRYLAGIGVATREKGRWHIGVDERPRVVVLYSHGRAIEIVVSGYDEAAQVGLFMSATAMLQATNDPAVLAPFVGKGVRDIRGHFHRFETDPNELFRLMAAGPEPFELIYRIVV